MVGMVAVVRTENLKIILERYLRYSYTLMYIYNIYIRIYIPPFWVWPDLSCIDSSWLVDFPILGRSGHDVLPGSESRGWWIFQQTMRLATRGY